MNSFLLLLLLLALLIPCRDTSSRLLLVSDGIQGGIWDERTRGEKNCGSRICWAQDWLRMGDGREPTQLRKNREIAEIPVFPTSWWITFDLKLTKTPQLPFFHSIIHIFGSSLPTPYAPSISYRPALRFTKHPAQISIKHWLGTFFYRYKTKELLPGKWTRFEISQAMDNGKLMFKVVIGGEVLLSTEQTKPYEGPVTVYASGPKRGNFHKPALPALIRNLRIDLPGEVISKRRYGFMNQDWKAAVVQHNVRSNKIVDGSECCHRCKREFPETKAWQKFKLYNMCECFSYDDDFDPSDYTKKHGAYSIGTCK